jgi:hypothetical protein
MSVGWRSRFFYDMEESLFSFAACAALLGDYNKHWVVACV